MRALKKSELAFWPNLTESPREPHPDLGTLPELPPRVLSALLSPFQPKKAARAEPRDLMGRRTNMAPAFWVSSLDGS